MVDVFHVHDVLNLTIVSNSHFVQARPEQPPTVLPVSSPGDHHAHRSEYLSIADVAEALGVTPRTINNYFNAGRLHRIRVSPKVVLVARSEIDALLTGRRD